MHGVSDDIIREKAAVCRARIEGYARMACGGALLNPIPFGDLVVNFAVIVHATLAFVQILGLHSRMYDTPGYTAAVFQAGEVAMKTDLARLFGAGGTILVTVGSVAVAELVAELISPGYWAAAGLKYSALLTCELVADFLPLIGWGVGGVAAYYFKIGRAHV